MCDSFPATCHDAVTQLDYFGDADNLLGVVALIRQQHQEEKDVGNDGLRISVCKMQHLLRSLAQQERAQDPLTEKLTWTVPIQCTQTALGQTLWTPEAQKKTANYITEFEDARMQKCRCVFFCFLPDLNPVGSSWLWAVQAGRAGPAPVSGGPQRCWWCTALKLWSPVVQRVECGCGWHSGKTKAAGVSFICLCSFCLRQKWTNLVSSVTCCICDVEPQLIRRLLHHIKPSESKMKYTFVTPMLACS